MSDQIVQSHNPAIEWLGTIEVEHQADWSRGWRLPHSRIDLFPGDELRERAMMPAGVRLRFGTDSTMISGAVRSETPSEELPPVDLVVDDAVAGTTSIGTDGQFQFNGLPAHDKIVELWLPQFGDVRLAHLSIDDSATLHAPVDTTRPKLITYGSSITQCRSAASPTRTWPALVARNLGFDLTCLGFGGQAHLDPMIARMIGSLSADVITTCLGINVYGSGTFTARSFLPAVLGFLTTIRDGHPTTPVLVITPIYAPNREQQPGPGGMTLREIRSSVEEGVRILQQCGDSKLHLLNGLDVFGEENAELLPDDLHPDARGYELMADAIAPAIKTITV